jgi:hypothetical protein
MDIENANWRVGHLVGRDGMPLHGLGCPRTHSGHFLLSITMAVWEDGRRGLEGPKLREGTITRTRLMWKQDGWAG